MRGIQQRLKIFVNRPSMFHSISVLCYRFIMYITFESISCQKTINDCKCKITTGKIKTLKVIYGLNLSPYLNYSMDSNCSSVLNIND